MVEWSVRRSQERIPQDKDDDDDDETGDLSQSFCHSLCSSFQEKLLPPNPLLSCTMCQRDDCEGGDDADADEPLQHDRSLPHRPRRRRTSGPNYECCNANRL